MSVRCRSVRVDVDIDLDDFSDDDLIDELLGRMDAADLVRKVKEADGDKSVATGAEKPLLHEFDDTVEDLRRAAWSQRWDEFLHLFDRFLPRDLMGVDREIAAYFRGHA